ncbi:MAG: hypothetical protein A3H28_13000 [Acidobacteria bacterium RIFCSPLOWO2_02_FULL_61_28]|nr:MAG: hypothetical protein A3H28_13000 [Acidobacteria bacterium RIFCSPLOWO2_02_FULL_61_28]
MFLDIHDLARQPIALDQTLPPGRIDFGEDVWQVERLEVHGWAELVEEEIRLRGSLRTTIEVPCARCLERTRLPVEVEFDLFYRPIQTISRNEEVEIKGEDLDIGFYHGDGLLLEEALREQILLSLPMKSICRTDCAGLCPQCGQNRNVGECGCGPARTDERWTPLARLKR